MVVALTGTNAPVGSVAQERCVTPGSGVATAGTHRLASSGRSRGGAHAHHGLDTSTVGSDRICCGSLASRLAASPAGAADPAVPSIDWQTCGGDHPTAECATVEVPLDYDVPSRRDHVRSRSRGSRRRTPSAGSAPSSSTRAGPEARAWASSSTASARPFARTSAGASTSSASTRAGSAPPIPCTASTARMTWSRSCPQCRCSRTSGRSTCPSTTTSPRSPAGA